MRSDFNYHGPVVVFDLDDTLIRERDFVRSGFRLIRNILMERYGVSMLGVAMRLDTRLSARSNYFELLRDILALKTPRNNPENNNINNNEPEKNAPGNKNPAESNPELEASELMLLYRNHLPESLPLADDVEDTLEELQRIGVVMAIVTDGRSVTQRSKIKAAGIDRFVAPENIFISEEVGVDKNSPDSFQEIVRRYPEARQFIYVGDNCRRDFMIPNLLGWKTLKVPYNCDNVHINAAFDDILQAPTMEMISFSQILEEIKQ